MATTEDPRAGIDSTAEWRRELYGATPERQGELFSTISGLENAPLYTPDTVERAIRVLKAILVFAWMVLEGLQHADNWSERDE